MGLVRKATLYSGLVLPGLGQWILGHRVKAVFFMATVIILVVLLAARIFLLVYNALVPGGDILQLKISPGLVAEVHARAYQENWWLLLAIIVLWLASVIHAWATARKISSGKSNP